MKGKVLLIAAAVGVGFLLGSRAGREPYEKFSAGVKKVWESPRVQTQVDRSMKFANDRVDDLVGIVGTGVRNLVDRVTGGRRRKASAALPASSAESL